MAISEKRKAYLKEYRIKKRQKLIDYFIEYRNTHKKEITEYRLKYNDKNTQKVKRYMKKYKKSYVTKNKEKIREKSRQYKNMKYGTDPEYKLMSNYRSRLGKALRSQGVRKANKTRELIGCSILELKSHIESLFTENMNWTNHGYGSKKWHVDHIIPCSFFDLSDQTELKQCFHYSNLRPLWQADNLKKSDKISY